MNTLTYDVDGRVARITLNRPERGNGITMEMPSELAECVERANLDPDVHVIALAGAGKGSCGGYDLVEFAEGQIPNHDPTEPWDPILDWQMMGRNLRGFMSCSTPTGRCCERCTASASPAAPTWRFARTCW